MAIWGVVRRKRDVWAIRSENANWEEFEGQKMDEPIVKMEKF